MEAFLSYIANIITSVISHSGYGGITFLMVLESTGIPVPSEVIMPFSGFLVTREILSFWGVVVAGTLGNLAGSFLAYWIALKGGQPLIKKVGRYIFLSEHDLNKSEQWFAKYGSITVFIGRLLPIIRTYISFPAGLAKMPLKRFIFYTILGSLPWSILLTYLGLKAGDNWEFLREKFRDFDYLILAVLMAGIIYWIFRHTKYDKKF